MSDKQMKIAALGGCGGMGQFAVKTALGFDFVDEIIVADLVGERAKEFASKCGEKVKPLELDITDSDALDKLLAGVDVVMSTVGPYYRFGPPILTAAIKNSCDYIDICDDWEAALEMMKMSDDAQDAGITAILGMGASPGITNLLAVKAAVELDDVHDLYTGWGQGDVDTLDIDKPGEGGSYSAAIEHLVQQITGTIKVWKNGELTDVAPLEKIELEFPGIGKTPVHTVGHPEPVTLPMYMPELKNSYNVTELPGFFVKSLIWLAGQVDAGKMSIKEATEKIVLLEEDPKNLLFTPFGLRNLWTLVLDLFRDRKSINTYLPMLFAVAVGTKDAKPKTAAASLTSLPDGGIGHDNMGGVTGVPLAVLLKLLHNGNLNKKGVFAPEMAVDPDEFFDVLGPFCNPQENTSSELVKIAYSGNY
jgi:saccharopine dehydrogenase-like NADP-dependent oxidoreductase